MFSMDKVDCHSKREKKIMYKNENSYIHNTANNQLIGVNKRKKNL